MTMFTCCFSAAWRLDSNTNRFQPVLNYPDRKLIAASVATDDGSIWLIHAGSGLAPCIGRVSIDDKGGAAWVSHSVEGLASIGVPQTIFAQPAEGGKTILWIGGTSGILRHEVAHGLFAPPPRPPLLRAVARNSKNDAPQAITGPLPYSTRSIEFEFAEPDFTRRAALRLQTRFIGVDRDWVPADPTSRQTLTAVREGTIPSRFGRSRKPASPASRRRSPSRCTRPGSHVEGHGGRAALPDPAGLRLLSAAGPRACAAAMSSSRKRSTAGPRNSSGPAPRRPSSWPT